MSQHSPSDDVTTTNISYSARGTLSTAVAQYSDHTAKLPCRQEGHTRKARQGQTRPDKARQGQTRLVTTHATHKGQTRRDKRTHGRASRDKARQKARQERPDKGRDKKARASRPRPDKATTRPRHGHDKQATTEGQTRPDKATTRPRHGRARRNTHRSPNMTANIITLQP